MPIAPRTWWNLGLGAILLLVLGFALRERRLQERDGLPAPPRPAVDAGAIPLGAPSLDLLQIISVSQEVVNGDWAKDAEGLKTGDAPYSRLALVPPPGEYDLQLEVERRQGEDSLDLGLVADGRQFLVVIDGWTKGELSGIDLIHEKPFFGNLTTYGGRLLALNRPTELVASVRKSGVTLKVDGRVVFQWPADYAGVRLYPEWKIPDPSKLFIGSYATRFLIRRLVLVDRTQG